MIFFSLSTSAYLIVVDPMSMPKDKQAVSNCIKLFHNFSNKKDPQTPLGALSQGLPIPEILSERGPVGLPNF